MPAVRHRPEKRARDTTSRATWVILADRRIADQNADYDVVHFEIHPPTSLTGFAPEDQPFKRSVGRIGFSRNGALPANLLRAGIDPWE